MLKWECMGMRGNVVSDRGVGYSSHCGVGCNVGDCSFTTGLAAVCSAWCSLFQCKVGNDRQEGALGNPRERVAVLVKWSCSFG